MLLEKDTSDDTGPWPTHLAQHIGHDGCDDMSNPASSMEGLDRFRPHGSKEDFAAIRRHGSPSTDWWAEAREKAMCTWLEIKSLDE